MENQEIDVRPFAYALSLISGKWKMHILFWLWKKEPLRYSELKRCLGTVTHKMLSAQLKELESDGLILRREYPQIPPRVEYSLTFRGQSMMPILSELCRWGHHTCRRMFRKKQLDPGTIPSFIITAGPW